jgi:thiol-disulfide isomerase/thioredoxin
LRSEYLVTSTLTGLAIDRPTSVARSGGFSCALAGLAGAADQPAIRAALQSATERKPAPKFALKDGSGKTVRLKDYRGRVVLLDFWATWCHGCKEEIPWFSDFQRTYGAKGFAVVGVSLDEGGWNVLKPFLADAKVPYRMLLGDDLTAQFPKFRLARSAAF